MRGYSAGAGISLLLFAAGTMALAQDPPARPAGAAARVAVPQEPPETSGPVPAAVPRARAGEDGPAECRGVGCPPTELEVARELLATGPDTTSTFETFENQGQKFAVVGFVREKWPVTVEYVAEPDTVTVLRVKLYHHRKILFIFPLPFFEVAFEQNLDALPVEKESEDPRSRTVLIPEITLSREADAAADADPHVARFEIVSYRLDGDRIRRENGHSVRAPVQVVGMAVGPAAVGSLTLRSGTLAGTRIRIPAPDAPRPKLAYSYVTDDMRYDLLRVTFEQYLELRWRFQGDVAQPHPGGAQTLYTGNWEVGPERAAGDYRLSMSGWYTCGGGTISARLTECADSPAWSVLHTGRFRLVP